MIKNSHVRGFFRGNEDLSFQKRDTRKVAEDLGSPARIDHPLALAKRPAIVKGPETGHNLHHGHYYGNKQKAAEKQTYLETT